MEQSAAAPRHLQLKPTTRCNLRCRTCNLWRRVIEGPVAADGRPRRLPDARVLEVLDEMASWGSRWLEVADGEPLLRPSTLSFLERASARGLETLLITNGTLLSERLAARLVAFSLGRLVVSLDGPGELHDRLRGVAGTYRRLAAGVARILEQRRRAGSERPALLLHCTVSRLNFAELPGVVAAAAELGAPAVVFRYLSRLPPEAVAATNRILGGEYASPVHHYAVEEDLRLGEPEIRRLGPVLRLAAATGRRLGIEVGLDRLLRDMAAAGRATERRFDGRGCLLVGDYLQISPRGEVHPCPMLTGCGLGNLGRRGAREIFLDPQAVALRARIQERFPLPICPHCCYRER